MKVMVLIASVLVAGFAFSQPTLPTGVWYGSSSSSQAVFGYFVISESKLTWGWPGNANFSKPWCHAGFKVVDQSVPASLYARFPSPNIVSFRLKFVDQTCEPTLEGVRVSYERKQGAPIRLDLVVYGFGSSEYQTDLFKLDDAAVSELDALLRSANESR
jgi:hypothetical protein